MFIEMFKSKIHRATITQADLHYVGSLTVDRDLLDAAGIRIHEKVQVVDIDNGARFETYVIEGERGSGTICMNGACARLGQVGDKVIIMSYAQMTPEEADLHLPKAVMVDDGNRILEVKQEAILPGEYAGATH